MRKIYTIQKKLALVPICASLLLSTTNVFSQQTSPCGQVVENFNNTGGSTAGFTGSFSFATAGSNGYLVKDKVLNFAKYSITTATYQLAANQTVVGYGFTLGGTTQVSRITVNVQYRSTTTNEVITVPINPQVVPVYNPQTNISEVCGSVDFSDLPGFPSGGPYRFVFELDPTSGAGLATDTITFDDFRSNGTRALIPLPVTFISFEAKKTGSNVLLTWKIAGEVNVDRYEVERSEDGRNFASVATIARHGKDVYTHTDVTNSSTVYYRIKNVDTDGKFKFSTVARIVNGKSEIVLKAFPQPAQNVLTVQHPVISGKSQISISSADGRVISSVVPTTGSMQTYLDFSTLQKGMYMIRFDAGNGTVETLKILKQ
jgi:hypothetical protein